MARGLYVTPFLLKHWNKRYIATLFTFIWLVLKQMYMFLSFFIYYSLNRIKSRFWKLYAYSNILYFRILMWRSRSSNVQGCMPNSGIRTSLILLYRLKRYSDSVDLCHCLAMSIASLFTQSPRISSLSESRVLTLHHSPAYIYQSFLLVVNKETHTPCMHQWESHISFFQWHLSYCW